MPKVGKKHFKYTKKGRKAAKAYAKSIEANIAEQVTGAVGAHLKQRTRQRTVGDPTSIGRSSPLQKIRGIQTPIEKQSLNLSLRQRKVKGKGLDPRRSVNPSSKRAQTRLGITAGTEMNWKDKLVEELVEGHDPEGEGAWKGFWKDKDEEGKKKPKGVTRASKKTRAAAERAVNKKKKTPKGKAFDKLSDKEKREEADVEKYLFRKTRMKGKHLK